MARLFAEGGSLGSEVEADGARFAMIVFPFRFQVETGAPAASAQEEIMSFCGAGGLRCLHRLPAFQAAGAPALLHYDRLRPAGGPPTADSVRASRLRPRG